MSDNQKAILAGGCFWGMQDLIRNCLLYTSDAADE